jgi:hypothetical protein
MTRLYFKILYDNIVGQLVGHKKTSMSQYGDSFKSEIR